MPLPPGLVAYKVNDVDYIFVPTTSGSGLPPIDPGGANEGEFLWVQSTAGPNQNTAQWVTLTQAMIAPNFAASLAGPSGPLEVGASLVNPTFTASYNETPTGATINDGSGALALSPPYTSYAYTKTYTKTTINASQSWTLAATAATGSTTTGASITWEARAYYGTAASGTYNQAYITALANNLLKPGFAGTFTFGAGGGTQFFNYAFPTAFGTPSNFKDTSSGFAVPFGLVASAVNVTNVNGVVIPFDIWQSSFAQNAGLTIAVS